MFCFLSAFQPFPFYTDFFVHFIFFPFPFPCFCLLFLSLFIPLSFFFFHFLVESLILQDLWMVLPYNEQVPAENKGKPKISTSRLLKYKPAWGPFRLKRVLLESNVICRNKGGFSLCWYARAATSFGGKLNVFWETAWLYQWPCNFVDKVRWFFRLSSISAHFCLCL